MCDNSNCDSDRILNLYAHSKDMGNTEYCGVGHEGYFPTIDDICCGDDAQMDICMECGKVQGTFPKDHELIIKAFKEADGEDDNYDDDFEFEDTYTEEELNNDLIRFKIIPNKFTEEQVVPAYDLLNDESWKRFIKVITKYLRPDMPFNDEEALELFKQLPLQLRACGIIRGIDNTDFIKYSDFFIDANKDHFKF